MTLTDSIFIVIFVALFLLVVIDAMVPTVRFLFLPSVFGQSLYSVISGALILYYGLIWGVRKVADQIKKEKNSERRLRTLISKAFEFIGLVKMGPIDSLYVSFSMLTGMVFNILILYGVAISSGGILYRRPFPSDIYLTIRFLIVAPLFEELIFRGVYLSAFLKILGRNYISVALGLMLSSITFGWIHTDQFPVPVIKTAGAFLLGIIYLAKWKKNFLATYLAHFGLNFVGVFLYVGHT